MKSLPSKISASNFKKALGGAKGYISSAQRQKLKSAGLGDVLGKSQISKSEALKAIHTLQKEGELSKNVAGSEILSRHIDQTPVGKTVNSRSHLSRFLTIKPVVDVENDLLGDGQIKYTKRSFSSLTEKIEYEKKVRDTKVAQEKQKRGKLLNAGVKPVAPTVVNLPDMDIG